MTRSRAARSRTSGKLLPGQELSAKSCQVKTSNWVNNCLVRHSNQEQPGKELQIKNCQAEMALSRTVQSSISRTRSAARQGQACLLKYRTLMFKRILGCYSWQRSKKRLHIDEACIQSIVQEELLSLSGWGCLDEKDFISRNLLGTDFLVTQWKSRKS